ncbi:hypothetical protein IWQ56_001287 [Coemansia nantahalensis]|nr:hypothetical protein IWQ56_001287 [Coemansia nantahalensis]
MRQNASRSTPRIDPARQEELIADEVRGLLQRNEPVEWYEMAVKHKLTQDSLLRILSEHNAGAKEWVRLSCRVTALADRYQDPKRGRSDWEAVARAANLTVVDALCLFDEAASQVPVRERPSFADWSMGDIGALRGFLASNFSAPGNEEWRMAAIYMNTRPADCKYVFKTLDSNTMTYDLLMVIKKRLNGGHTWDVLYADYPITHDAEGLQRLYFKTLYNPAMLRERRDRHKWTVAENNLFTRIWRDRFQRGDEAKLAIIMASELTEKSMMEIEDKIEYKLRKIGYTRKTPWRRTKPTIDKSEVAADAKPKAAEPDAFDLSVPPTGKKQKGPISVPREIAESIVALKRQGESYDKISSRLAQKVTPKQAKAVYLQKTAKPAPREITPEECAAIKALVDENAETMQYDALRRLIREQVGKDNWCNVLNFLDGYTAAHPVYKARLDGADTLGLIAEMLRGKSIVEMARRLNVSSVVLNVHIRTQQYQRFPKKWTQEETDVLIARIDQHGTPSNWEKVAALVKTKTARQCEKRYRELQKLNLV